MLKECEGARSVNLRHDEGIGCFAFMKHPSQKDTLVFVHGGRYICRMDLTNQIVYPPIATSGSPISALDVDSCGNIWFATKDKISIIDADTNQVSFVAGGGRAGNDATGTAAGFADIRSLVVSTRNSVFVAESCTVREVKKSGDVTTIAEARGSIGHVDGTGITAQFRSLYQIALDDSDGSLYVADFGNHRIRRISADFVVSTVAGNGEKKCVDGVGTASSFCHPVSIASNKGWHYVIDYHSVRCISPRGVVTTIAGGSDSGMVDKAGDSARLTCAETTRLATDGRGRYVFNDTYLFRQFFADVDGYVPIPPSALISDLSGLLDEPDLCDVVFVPRDSKENEEAKAEEAGLDDCHTQRVYSLRGFLRARCSFFATALVQDKDKAVSSELSSSGGRDDREHCHEEIEFPGSYGAMWSTLHFLHTGKLEVEDSDLIEVLHVAEMWGAARLKKLCEQEFAVRLTPGKVCVFLDAASKYKASHLEQICLEYVSNHFEAVRTAGDLFSLDKVLLVSVMKLLRL